MEIETIRSGMAYAIWEHAADRYDPSRKKLGPDRAVPAPAMHAARDLEHLLLKMNCVTTLEELLTPGLDTDLGDFGYRLAKDALRVKYTGYQIGVLTPTFHAKIEEHARRKGDPIEAELEWHGEIELGIEGESRLDMESIRQGPGPTVRRVKNPRGAFTAKGERMYEHVKHSEHGSPRAKEIAARTVYARAEEGVPGLLANPTREHGPFRTGWRLVTESGHHVWVFDTEDGNIQYKVKPFRNGWRVHTYELDGFSAYYPQTYDHLEDAKGFVETHANFTSNPSRWPASEVQSLLFDKTVFTEHQAKEWAREHGYHYGKVDTTGSYHRLRQEAPTGGPCRTIEFTQGVKAIVCSSAHGRPPGVPHGR